MKYNKGIDKNKNKTRHCIHSFIKRDMKYNKEINKNKKKTSH